MSAVFKYQALDASGKTQTGEIEGDDRVSVLRDLSAKGFQVFDLVAASDRKESIWSKDLFQSSSVKTQDLTSFLRMLATLVSAKLPVDQALAAGLGEDDNKSTRALAGRLRDRVQSGQKLSEAFEIEAGLPPALAAMIAAGEESGSLGEVLEACAEDEARREELGGQVKSALIYPALLGCMAIVSLVFIITVLLPALKPLIEETGGEFPEPARSLNAIGESISAAPLIWAIGAGAVIAGLVTAISSAAFRAKLDQFMIRVPLIGPLIRDLQSRSTLFILGLTLKHKVDPVRATQIARATVSSALFKTGLERVGEDLKSGRTLSDSLLDHTPIKQHFSELIKAGERSGEVAGMLLHAGEIANQQAKRRLERLVGLLTPALTLLLGVLIGGLVLSVVTALMSANDAVF